MDDGDFPVISLPTDSTKIEGIKAVNEQKPQPAGEPRQSPAPEIRRPASSDAMTARPGAAPAARPALPPADPRKASEMRKPGSVTPQAPRPAPAAPAAPAAEAVDEDPEKLLREYAERQKTKVLRLEQQLVELKKTQAERDGLRAKSEALARELGDARKQLEAAAKADDVITDLQGKVDAALLSSSMEKEEMGKLRARNEALDAAIKKAEERAAHAEKSLGEAQRSLASQSEGRREAEARVAGALQALQGEVSKAATVKVPSAEPPAGLRHAEAAPGAQSGKPAEKHAVAHAAAPKPAINIVRK